jgi:hypothetical protein
LQPQVEFSLTFDATSDLMGLPGQQQQEVILHGEQEILKT